MPRFSSPGLRVSSQPPYSRRVQRSLVALVLVAITLVVYAPIVLGGDTWDDARYHLEVAPPRIAAADAVLHGELPAWWEGTGLGVPLLAEPTHGAAYPLAWIAATPRTLDLLLVMHVLWCALGVALLARRLKASELGAVIAGVLVATSGVIASAALRGVLPALAHLPWLAIASIQLTRARTRRRQLRAATLIAGFVALVGLAGHLVVLGDAIAIVLLAGFRRASKQGAAPTPSVGGAYAFMAIALAVGAAIACVQWLPYAFTMSETAGARLPALSMSAVLDLVVPRATAGWFPTLYIGVPVIALAAIARPPVGVVVVAALLAIGGFVVRGGDVQIAVLSLVAAAYAARGFDRVCAWAPGKLRLVVVAVALAPTVIALPMLLPTIDRAIVEERPAWQRAAERVRVWPRRVFRPVMSFPGKPDPNDATLADRIATFSGTASAKWGTGVARSEDPARPIDHDRVWAAAAAVGGALFDRFGIALAILPSSMLGGGAAPKELSRRGPWALVELPASPSAAVVYEWMFAPDVESSLARLFPPGAAQGLSSGVIVLVGAGAQNQDEPGPARPCKLVRWDAGAIDLECTAERGAYAVVSSTAARGWTAHVDGRETAWLVADVMRRAVPLTPGTHKVVWRYSAPGLWLGLALAALGIAVLVALWLVYGRDPDARDRSTDSDRTDVN
jgi:hypothetical protein